MSSPVERNFSIIINEISHQFNKTKFENAEPIIEEIIRSQRIVTVGAGRVGLSMRAFAKRLKHLGKDSYFIYDEVLPKFNSNDLMLIASGSGETASILVLAEKCKKFGVKLVLITGKGGLTSSIARISDSIFVLGNLDSKSEFQSVQPMTTLFEQGLFLMMDALVLTMMESMNLSNFEMEDRHNVFE